MIIIFAVLGLHECRYSDRNTGKKTHSTLPSAGKRSGLLSSTRCYVSPSPLPLPTPCRTQQKSEGRARFHHVVTSVFVGFKVLFVLFVSFVCFPFLRFALTPFLFSFFVVVSLSASFAPNPLKNPSAAFGHRNDLAAAQAPQRTRLLSRVTSSLDALTWWRHETGSE